MRPLVVWPRGLTQTDSESSEDRQMILVLIAISSSSLVFLTTLGIVFGSLNYISSTVTKVCTLY